MAKYANKKKISLELSVVGGQIYNRSNRFYKTAARIKLVCLCARDRGSYHLRHNKTD